MRSAGVRSREPLAPELVDALLGCDYFAARRASRVELVWASDRPVSNVHQVRVWLEPEPRLFWVKTYSTDSPGGAEREYRFLRDTHAAFRGHEQLGVIRAVAYVPEVEAVVTEHSDGVPLATLIRRSLNRISAPFSDGEKFERHLERCGSWLAVLHSAALPESEAFDVAVLQEYVDVRLQALEREAAIGPEFRRRVAAHLESLTLRFEPEALRRVRTHGDYGPYNVLASEDRLVGMDPGVGSYLTQLDRRCSRYEDIAHFHVFTRAMSSPLIAGEVRRRLAATFLRSYAAAAGVAVAERSAAFRAFELKWELLEVTGMAWPSLLGRLTSRRARLARFRRWFERACSD